MTRFFISQLQNIRSRRSIASTPFETAIRNACERPKHTTFTEKLDVLRIECRANASQAARAGYVLDARDWKDIESAIGGIHADA